MAVRRGGAAQRRHTEPKGAELRVAGVGPLISLLLAVVFFLVAVALQNAGVTGLALGVFAWLASINVVLAVFNLIPAAPLDGGRVLRAILWRRHGDRQRAAITAAQAGRAFGWLLVLVGLLLFVSLAGFGGLWFVLIGWFIINAADAEAQHARMQSVLADVRVRDVMTADPVPVPATISVEEFLERYVFPNRFSSFPVVAADGSPVGLVTLNRVKQVPPEQRRSTTVGEVACPLADVAVASPDEPLANLLPRLAACADGRALVVEDGRVVGIVSPTDIAYQLEIADLRGARELRAQHV